MTRRERLYGIVRHYWDLGFISFGGPGVHVIILRKRFVESLHWHDSKTFLDLFALGNALPGTWIHAAGVLYSDLAVGVSRIPDMLPPIVLALLTGLNAAAVGLIAFAAVQLAKNAGTDRITVLLLWLSASFGVCYHAPWMYPTLIATANSSCVAEDEARASKSVQPA
ncbi:hypothetical protein EHS25_001740 [Saitozyma podzolica]|uniref:Chromate transporter n=1 Tax=Saitozyma podzolica TaxID=1890683 RepID=A0A427YFQ1_9TREE|nr:hypothetical protein EHS25_001740 [Saitozyma podzolica]